MTMERQASLYLSMPIASTSSLLLMPSSANTQTHAERAAQHSASVPRQRGAPRPREGRLRRTERFVDFVLHGQAVAVPAEAARAVVPGGGGEARHHVLRTRRQRAVRELAAAACAQKALRWVRARCSALRAAVP
jgi:hypothetical protein